MPRTRRSEVLQTAGVLRMPMGMPSWKADVLAKVATVTMIRDLAGYSTTVRIYKCTAFACQPARGDGP